MIVQWFNMTKTTVYSTSCDGWHFRPPVLALLLETIEREIFDELIVSLVSNLQVKNCAIC